MLCEFFYPVNYWYFFLTVVCNFIFIGNFNIALWGN